MHFLLYSVVFFQHVFQVFGVKLKEMLILSFLCTSDKSTVRGCSTYLFADLMVYVGMTDNIESLKNGADRAELRDYEVCAGIDGVLSEHSVLLNCATPAYGRYVVLESYKKSGTQLAFRELEVHGSCH